MMENSSQIEIWLLSNTPPDRDMLIQSAKDFFSDRIEYYEGCLDFEITTVDEIGDKGYFNIRFVLDENIGTELYGVFAADTDDEVAQMHGMTLYLREGIASGLSDMGDWLIFSDEFCEEFCAATYKEIAELENSLRAVLNLIFSFATGSFDNFFEVSQVNALGDYQKDAAKNYQQNELHYLSFSDYSKAADSKVPNLNSLIEGLQNSRDFDEFKGEVFPALVREEKHLDFMASLKRIMDSLEKMRNCIAHNRLPSSTLLENYIKSRADLRSVISEFWTVKD